MSSPVECPVFCRLFLTKMMSGATLRWPGLRAKFLGCVPMVLYLELWMVAMQHQQDTAAAAASLLLPHFNHGPWLAD